MIKLCIFDLDGTLIDSVEDLADSTNYALARRGLPTHPVKSYYTFVGNGIPKLIERASGIPQGEPGYQEIYDGFMEYYDAHSTDKTVVYDGMPEVVQQINRRGILCAVLSNKADVFVKQLMETLFPAASFVRVQGKNDAYPAKPHPASLNALIKELGMEKSECIYVGDSNVDVFTAHNAGIPCIGVEWGFRGREELVAAGAEFLAQKPFDILTYL
ncbi:putative phosphoglycolate phosphatase, bacterial [[Clostridium] methylpentosum DSM 5476]|uniref:Putative phosphoglycolate phosphatase, bacterial n=1 Tax=[Clostridium] methylpentosum DSM 5476 TaxID=537013 RepID=C0EEV6_9FIRM|nr:putative phosphoglycolate phosphatase, bacterial [[Clostridium] methylpentosum DSM 5476]MDY3988330.1 HAD-IA family hydrolase [Massilioclostridium sp.]MEE1491547.1 HAD-IA family hydrolase [Massilioclostridium sp.]